MFFPEGHIRVYLYGQPVDMRKSFDGLYALSRHGLRQDPLNGQLFAFVNRRATHIKVLYFDRSGWCLWAKRLEAGSPYDCGLSLLHPHAANWFMDSREPKLTGNAHPNIYPYDAFPTRTAPIFLAVGNDRQFSLLCRHLGVPERAEDATYARAGDRSSNRAALREQLVALLSEHDGPALAQALMDIGVPCAPVLSVSAALNHPHTAHREMIVVIGDNYTGVASPIKLSRTPATYRHPPPL